MTEKAIKEIIASYNNTVTNAYKSNWGSLLTFLGMYIFRNSRWIDLASFRWRRHQAIDPIDQDQSQREV
jgi:hypothetical protein